MRVPHVPNGQNKNGGKKKLDSVEFSATLTSFLFELQI